MAEAPALIIFARAPVAGRVKTRLSPALTPGEAAELYRCFLLDMLTLAAHSPADVIVAAAGEADLPVVQSLATETCPRGRVTVQEGADLGERMLDSFRQAFADGHQAAVILGTDAPSLPWDYVATALELAAARDVVLGPCPDGGYYLIGMHAAIPELFTGIPWSMHTVLVQTLARARAMDLSISLLRPWYDIDEPRDLALLRTHLQALSLAGETITCPHTWRYLAEGLHGG